MIGQSEPLIFKMKKKKTKAWWDKVTDILNRLSGGVDSA